MSFYDFHTPISKLTTIAVNSEDLIIFFLYDSYNEAAEAANSLFELFGDNEVRVNLDFKLYSKQFKQPENGNKIDTSTGSLDVTIFDVKGEFVLIKEIKINTGATTLKFHLYGIALEHEYNLSLDNEYRFAQLVCGVQTVDGLSAVCTSDGDSYRGLSNILEFTILPPPSWSKPVPGPPIMIDPK